MIIYARVEHIRYAINVKTRGTPPCSCSLPDGNRESKISRQRTRSQFIFPSFSSLYYSLFSSTFSFFLCHFILSISLFKPNSTLTLMNHVVFHFVLKCKKHAKQLKIYLYRYIYFFKKSFNVFYKLALAFYSFFFYLSLLIYYRVCYVRWDA